MYPPSPIRDLALTQDSDTTFNLTFTFPGADLNTGNISQYLVFYSENRTMLDDLTSFPLANITDDILFYAENMTISSNLSIVTEDMLDCSECDLEPREPFAVAMIRVSSSAFESETDYYFRVLAVDIEGKDAKTSTSNVVVFAPSPAPGVEEEEVRFWRNKESSLK